MPGEVELTLVDSEILNSYAHLLDGLSDYMGSSYELVLHSLGSFDHSVIAIVNGEHTGRKVGAPITNLALKMLSRLSELKGEDHITYFSTNANGEPLRSSTIAIKGEKDRIIGLLCINQYLNVPLNKLLEKYVNNTQDESKEDEKYISDSAELIRSSTERIRNEVMSDSAVKPSLKKKKIIAHLHAEGVFKFKDAVDQVANVMGISKNTVYLHLKGCKSKEE
ncbi:MAG: PAS domain-containing protein [Synergistes jonesii]|uniref:helix-turn-helix transcriptional regulator n=1 Tax=Synergistes jonesii TaxID=2754 RepID=UPI002A76355A|nr:PAS domain-containing protein [Synergistes jonesii]MDY2983705.1 PAS domain-containing protein [Synergistes jonesii]